MNNIFSHLKKGIVFLTKFASLKLRVPNATRQKKLFFRLPLRDRILFVKTLSVLIGAGVPLLSALEIVKNQSRSKTMVKIIDRTIEEVANGQYLANALGEFKKNIGELTINIIAVGEASGTLAENLNHLVLSLKKTQYLRGKLISASVYPIFIVAATLAITLALTLFLFPKLIPILEDLHYQLPWTTRLLIFVSRIIKSYGLFFMTALFFSIAVFWFWLKKNKNFHLWLDKLLISTPLIKHLIVTQNTANICRTLGLLLKSGITVVKAFQITSSITANLVYKNELHNLAIALTKGEKISKHLKDKAKIFAPVVSNMVAVGESTGHLSETFLYLSEVFEEQADELTKNLAAAAEPLLLIFMGFLVTFMAISIITPIYGITQNLRPN